jgi:hypothetical protein
VGRGGVRAYRAAPRDLEASSCASHELSLNLPTAVRIAAVRGKIFVA